MAEDGVVHYFRVKPGCREDAVCHDESVHQDNHFQFGCLKHGTYRHYHFQAAEVTNQIAYASVSLIIVQCPLQYAVFMTDSGIVESASGADALFEGNTGEAGHPHRGG